MGKFRRGFLLGALVAGAWTLFNVKQDGATTRRQLKEYVGELGLNSRQLGHDAGQINHSLQQIKEKGLPLLQTTIGEVQTLIRHFQESNAPRIRRSQEKLEKLTADIAQSDENLNKA